MPVIFHSYTEKESLKDVGFSAGLTHESNPQLMTEIFMGWIWCVRYEEQTAVSGWVWQPNVYRQVCFFLWVMLDLWFMKLENVVHANELN